VFEYDFMQNAFAAGTIVAIVSGLVGYFLVLRGQIFAGSMRLRMSAGGAPGATPMW
jgi:zinc/manganese transport system permease protein